MKASPQLVFIETMRVEKSVVPLLDLHEQRLVFGMYQNGLNAYVSQIKEQFKLEVIALLEQNQLESGKIRASISFDFSKVTIELQCEAFSRMHVASKKIGLFPNARKQNLAPWNAKTTERSLYNEALIYAKVRNWDDAVVLNEKGFIADACIFNILLLKNDILYCPSLQNMPVKGVFLEWLKQNSVFPIIETTLSVQDIENADVLLLCNAGRGRQIGSWRSEN